MPREARLDARWRILKLRWQKWHAVSAFPFRRFSGAPKGHYENNSTNSTASPFSPIVQDTIIGVIRKAKSNDEVIERSCSFFDFL